MNIHWTYFVNDLSVKWYSSKKLGVSICSGSSSYHNVDEKVNQEDSELCSLIDNPPIFRCSSYFKSSLH